MSDASDVRPVARAPRMTGTGRPGIARVTGRNPRGDFDLPPIRDFSHKSI